MPATSAAQSNVYFGWAHPGGGYYTDIVGASACIRRPSRCDLARGIVADDASGTVTFHLTAPDPEFLYELTEQDYAAPIPPETPNHDMGLDAIPGTGPYRIALARSNEVRFVRNPFFLEWSHAAQPDGNPDVIIWRRLRTKAAAAAAVEKGHADWLQSAIPQAAYRQTRIQSPAQLHSHALFAIEFLPFNTNLAPFRSVLVRRALNYAIDRNTIVRMYGGPAFATPTCQPLTPGMPGYVRYCPYTLHPRTDGAYSGPNLHYAKRLVARSGTRGDHITVWGSPDEGFVPPRMPFYIASVLRSLGYRTTVRLMPIAQDHDSHVLAPQTLDERRLAGRLPRPDRLHPTVLQLRRQQHQRLRVRPRPRPQNSNEPNPSNRERRPPQTRFGQPSITPSHTEPTGCRP